MSIFSQPEMCNVPNRPPKPVHLKPETSTPVKKAPMPLPQLETTCNCRCVTAASDNPKQSYLNNYDAPKTVYTNTRVSYNLLITRKTQNNVVLPRSKRLILFLRSREGLHFEILNLMMPAQIIFRRFWLSR